jgi:hypothetical protein
VLVINSTTFRIFTTKNSLSQVQTLTSTIVSTVPVFLIPTDGNLSRNQKIALGIGLGMGLPLLVSALLGIILCRNRPLQKMHQNDPRILPPGIAKNQGSDEGAYNQDI